MTVRDGNYSTSYYARNREAILAKAKLKYGASPRAERQVMTSDEKAEAKRLRRKRDLARHQERYATDPAYRASVREKANARYKAREEAKGRTLRVPMTEEERREKRRADAKARYIPRPRTKLTADEAWARKDDARRRERAAAKAEADYTVLTFEGLPEGERPRFAEEMLRRASLCQVCARVTWNARVDEWLGRYTDW